MPGYSSKKTKAILRKSERKVTFRPNPQSKKLNICYIGSVSIWILYRTYGMLSYLLNTKRSIKRLITLSYDVVAIPAAIYMALAFYTFLQGGARSLQVLHSKKTKWVTL